MNKSVTKTKKKLTIIFTMIVFSVILLLWITFLSFKYFNDLRIEKKSFLKTVNKMNRWELWIKSFIRFTSNSNNRELRFWRIREKNFNPRWFISHILVENNKIISSNVKENISEVFFNELLNEDRFNNLTQKNGLIIKKITVENSILILFKKLRYTFSNYSYDILIFVLINILFSSILYFIWLKFVNKAFVPVEENIKDMNEFVHNAGHEFKTPLSIIDSNIQIIKDKKIYNENMLDEIKDEAKKLNSLIDSLIKLSDIDFLKEAENLNLKQAVDEVVNNFKTSLSNKKLDMNIKIDKNAEIKADRNYLYILLSNLIWNAIKYNQKSWKIDILYKKWALTIKDTWIWISKDNVSKIFDRFYKADNSRNSKGFGIGLSLVKKISDIYKWEIKVESEEGKWSSFKIIF